MKTLPKKNGIDTASYIAVSTPLLLINILNWDRDIKNEMKKQL